MICAMEKGYWIQLNMYPRLQSSHPGIVFMEANGDKVRQLMCAQNPVIQTLNTTLQTAESHCPESSPFLHVPFRTKESKGAKFLTQSQTRISEGQEQIVLTHYFINLSIKAAILAKPRSLDQVLQKWHFSCT